jgi:hypothetical protein
VSNQWLPYWAITRFGRAPKPSIWRDHVRSTISPVLYTHIQATLSFTLFNAPVTASTHPLFSSDLRACVAASAPDWIDVEFHESYDYDYLLINGERFCGTTGPAGVVPIDGSMTWTSDDMVASAGWEICFFKSPPPQPPSLPVPPLPPPSPPSVPAIVVSGPCVLVGSCIRSSGYPAAGPLNYGYGSSESCIVTNLPAVAAQVVAFDVEDHSSCNFDYITTNGARYCGTSGPVGVVPADGRMTWTSDYYTQHAGWEICFFLTLLLPPQPPLQPSSPPVSPLPPIEPPVPPASPPADGLSLSPCALDARLSKPIQTRAHPPDSQMRTHACGRFRRTLDTYRHGMK